MANILEEDRRYFGPASCTDKELGQLLSDTDQIINDPSHPGMTPKRAGTIALGRMANTEGHQRLPTDGFRRGYLISVIIQMLGLKMRA